MNRLLELAKQDLSYAQDNLARAQMAIHNGNGDAEWGQSGQTLNEIIQGYLDWEKQAMEAVAAAEKLG